MAWYDDLQKVILGGGSTTSTTTTTTAPGSVPVWAYVVLGLAAIGILYVIFKK